jgi:hypothetical protein
MSTEFSFLGLLINLVGVWVVYRYSRKITNPSFFEAQRWHYFKKIVDWGIRFVVIGSGLQLIGVLIDLVRKHL